MKGPLKYNRYDWYRNLTDTIGLKCYQNWAFQFFLCINQKDEVMELRCKYSLKSPPNNEECQPTKWQKNPVGLRSAGTFYPAVPAVRNQWNILGRPLYQNGHGFWKKNLKSICSLCGIFWKWLYIQVYSFLLIILDHFLLNSPIHR